MRFSFFTIVSIGFLLFFGSASFWVWKDIYQVQIDITELKEKQVVLLESILFEMQEESSVVPSFVSEEIVSSSLVVEEPIEDIFTEEIITPEFVHLSVPFTSQAPEKNWDQPWQDACEEAAILMLDAYEKGYTVSPLFARDELLKMVEKEESFGWGGSIAISRVQEIAAWYMMTDVQKLSIWKYPTVGDIKGALVAGNPVLVVADGQALDNPYFTGDGPPYHALVIIGYDESTGEFITHDPGTQHGADFRYVYDNLMSAIHDWNGGDVANGVPVVLVYE